MTAPGWVPALSRGLRQIAVRSRTVRGEPEVEDLHVSPGRDEHVLRLQVTMHDTARVRRVERASDLTGVIDGLAARECHAAQRVAQRMALEQFHHRVGHAVVAAEIVNGEDVGVRERSDRVRFALEAGQPIGVGGECRRQDLDRDLPPQLRVARAIHFAHPAGAERVQDLVPAESRAGSQAHQPRIITVLDT